MCDFSDFCEQNCGGSNCSKETIVCTRKENPETCFLCEQEGKDYCVYCADNNSEINNDNINSITLPSLF